MRSTFLVVCALLILFVPHRLPALQTDSNARNTTPSIPLKAPSRWKTEIKDGITVLTPGDVGEGKVYVVMVTPLKDKAGSLEEVFKIGKKLIAEVGVFKSAAEAKQAETEGGWNYKFALGTVDKQGNSFLAQVMALKKATRARSFWC